MAEDKRRTARSWAEIRAELVASGRLDENGIAASRARILDAQRAYRLAELRKQQGARQSDLAAVLGVSQAAISKLERGDLSHTQLGTLAAYVDALGGTLRVTAEIGDQTITLADGKREHAEFRRRMDSLETGDTQPVSHDETVAMARAMLAARRK